MQRRFRANFEEKRLSQPAAAVTLWKHTMRDRFAATKALVGFQGYRGDMHMHTNHSDGAGTVAEAVQNRDHAGLDFIFITDHWGVTQKRECVRYENVWWGQEPGTQHHHLGILGIDRKFEPQQDLAADYQAVIDRGGVPYIPHPTGWFPVTRYNEEQIQALDLLGDNFTIEIINGANQIFDCWDITDQMSVELWDKHLKQGKHVTALGNTDAHLPHAVGDVWTGILADELSMEAMMDGVKRGSAFVSDGPIVDLTAEVDGTNIAGLGQTLKPDGKAVTLRILAADVTGLQTVRLIRDGEVIREWNPAGADAVSDSLADVDAGPNTHYYRLECRATDGRRAFTNPVYLAK
jgi:predicted metal-dependent phosphoesterase TrpH